MRPIRFEGMDIELQSPANFDNDTRTCRPLPIRACDNDLRISYWKPNFKDCIRMLLGCAIEFSCVSHFHPPIGLEVKRVKEIQELPVRELDNGNSSNQEI